MQITAEQLMREAQERQLEVVAPPSRQRIDDPEELAEFQLQKRKGKSYYLFKILNLVGI